MKSPNRRKTAAAKPPRCANSSPPHSAALIAAEQALWAFMGRPRVVAGHTVRPMTAGALALLQITQNKFLELHGTHDEALAQVAAWDDATEQAARFIFILKSPRSDVLAAIESGADPFSRAAERSVQLTANRNGEPIAKEIVNVLFQTFTVGNEPLQPIKKSGAISEKNHPAWLAAYLLTLSARTGWSYEFVLWELPLAAGIQLLHHIHHGANIKVESTEPATERLFQELEAQLKAATNARR